MNLEAFRPCNRLLAPRVARAGTFAVAARLAALLLLAAAFFMGSARASVEVRVESRPIGDDIQVFVTVTNDATGDPEPGLTASEFTVTLDGMTITPTALTQPPAQSTQRVSVVFAMDYSRSVRDVARAAMESAVTNFIDTMTNGDVAAIIKFTNTGDGVVLVQEFTEIDHLTGSSALIRAARSNHSGDGSPVIDAIDLAVNHIVASLSTLPAGPKAIILVSDGRENSSAATQSAVVANANDNSIPIFTIGVGNIVGEGGLELLTFLAADTGGRFLEAPDDAEIAAAYVTISELLNNSYLLTIPFDAVTDCDAHNLEVIVVGQAASGSATFARCDTTPDPISFTNRTGVALGAVITSDPVTVFGIDAPAKISVTGGTYSTGCGASFTAAAGTISKNQTVCVRHTASSAHSGSQNTTLTVGGVSGTFTSTTIAAQPANSGGGGVAGLAECFLALAALIARRRRHAATALSSRNTN